MTIILRQYENDKCYLIIISIDHNLPNYLSHSMELGERRTTQFTHNYDDIRMKLNIPIRRIQKDSSRSLPRI